MSKNVKFQTANSIGHITIDDDERIEDYLNVNQEQDDIVIVDDPEEGIYPTGIAEAMEEAEKLHDKHASPTADDINDEDGILYPTEVSEQLKMKDADVLKREYNDDEPEGMYPLNVSQ